MAETASLVISVRTTGADAAKRDLDGVTKSAGNTERATDKLSGTIKGLAAAFVAYGGAQVARQVIETADAFSGLQARLVLATGSADQAKIAYGDLLNLVRGSHADLQANAALYGTLAQSTKELGLSHKNLITITGSVSNALRVSGASATEAENVIRQLSQAFGSGVLRGDEFNSMMENGKRIAKALADSLGVEVGELRNMAAAGELTSAKLAKAFLDQSQTIQNEASKIPVTVGMAMQDLKNEMFNAVGPTATGPLVEALGKMRDVLADPQTHAGIQSLTAGLVSLVALATEGAAGFANLGNAIGEFAAKAVGGEDLYTALPKKIEGLKSALAGIEGSGFGDPTTIKKMRDELAGYEAQLAAITLRTQEQKVAQDDTGKSATDNTQAAIAHLAELDAKKQAQMEQEKLAEQARKEADRGAKQRMQEAVRREQQRLDGIRNYVQSLQDEAATLGMTNQQLAEYELRQKGATDADVKAAQAAIGKRDLYQLEQELKTEEERIAESYARRKQIIMDNMAPGAGRDQLMGRATDQFQKDMLGEFAAPTNAQDEIAAITARYEEKRAAMLEQEGVTQEMLLQLQTSYEEKKNQMMAEYNANRLGQASSLFDGLAGLAKSFAGEESKTYRTLFAISKGFSIAQATISMFTGMSKGLQMGIPAGLPAIAAAAAQGAQILGNIKGANYSGAYDKGGTIPAGSVGLVGEVGPELVRGPAVVTGREDTASMMGKSVKIAVFNLIDNAAMLESLKNSDDFDQVVVNSIGRQPTAARQAMG